MKYEDKRENKRKLKYMGVAIVLTFLAGIYLASATTVITDIQMTLGNVIIGPDKIQVGNTTIGGESISVNNSSGSTVLFVNGTSGNVGIGTTNPGAKLDVEEVDFGGAATIGSSANSATGNCAIAMGHDTDASGDKSIAMGFNTSASGYCSAAMGHYTTASGGYSTAMGDSTNASGFYSTAMGANFENPNDFSLAIGCDNLDILFDADGNSYINSGNVGIGTTNPEAKLDVEVGSGGAATIGHSSNSATGAYAIAMGYDTDASGHYSTAMGYNTNANGHYSTAMGYNTNASGYHSTAIGDGTKANGYASTAMGELTTANGHASTAIGLKATADAAYSIVLGSGVITGDCLVNDISNSLMVGFGNTTPTLFVDGSNVGIGTTNPASELHVIGKGTFTGGIDPPYISFSEESHESIRRYAEEVEEHEKVMQFWNGKAHRMEVYVISEDKFYTITGELVEE